MPGEASLGLSTIVPPFGLYRGQHNWPRMNTDKTHSRGILVLASFLSVFIRVHLWPIALRSGGCTARLVKQDPRGVGIHSPFLHLTIDRRASVWNPYLTGLRPSPPVAYPLKPAKVGLVSFCRETPVVRGSTAPLRSRLGTASLISRDLLLSPDREGGVLARRVGVSRQKLAIYR